MHNTVQLEIFARRKFLQISPPAFIGKNFIHEVFLCVKDRIADMTTFTALVKILSLENCYNTKVAWLGENFYPAKIFGIHNRYDIKFTIF